MQGTVEVDEGFSVHFIQGLSARMSKYDGGQYQVGVTVGIWSLWTRAEPVNPSRMLETTLKFGEGWHLIEEVENGRATLIEKFQVLCRPWNRHLCMR
jgi:hypothetical protein